MKLTRWKEDECCGLYEGGMLQYKVDMIMCISKNKVFRTIKKYNSLISIKHFDGNSRSKNLNEVIC